MIGEGVTLKKRDIYIDDTTRYYCIAEELPDYYLHEQKRGYSYTIQSKNIVFQRANFLQKTTQHYIDLLIHKWFARPKEIYNLFLDIRRTPKLIIKLSSRQRKSMKTIRYVPVTDSPERQKIDEKQSGQHLIIFPTIWSLYQYKLAGEKKIPKKHLGHIHGKRTPAQRRKDFNAIRNGELHTVCSTGLGLFFDRHNLQQITLLESDSRQYKRQRSPRIDIRECIEDIITIHNASYIYNGIGKLSTNLLSEDEQ